MGKKIQIAVACGDFHGPVWEARGANYHGVNWHTKGAQALMGDAAHTNTYIVEVELPDDAFTAPTLVGKIKETK